MKIKDHKIFYQRRLPHWQPIGATFFVTFRLKDSIPNIKLYELKQNYELEKELLLKTKPSNIQEALYDHQKNHFKKFDQLLEKIKSGPHYLKHKEVAELVAEQLYRFDGEMYKLYAFTIMSNHVHILIDTSIQLPEKIDLLTFGEIEFKPLKKIMQRIKGASSRYANLLLERTGQAFWQKESYDHFVRDAKEFNNIVAYILNNPVKAGLVRHWEDFPFSYSCPYYFCSQ